MRLPFIYTNPKIGGGERVRTDDLLLAKQVLSQLSYAPEKMVGLGRLELPTSRLSGVRSNQAELQARTVQKPLSKNVMIFMTKCDGSLMDPIARSVSNKYPQLTGFRKGCEDGGPSWRY